MSHSEVQRERRRTKMKRAIFCFFFFFVSLKKMDRGGGTGYAKEETEWDATLRKMGIGKNAGMPEPEQPKSSFVSEKELEAKAVTDKLDKASLDDLNDMEDDFDEEDDAVLARYREARLAELRQQAAASSRAPGPEESLREISASQWSSCVTDASRERRVLVLLYSPGQEWSALLEKHLCVLRAKFPTVSFLKIVARSAIADYPESRVPTILCYDGDKPIAQVTGSSPYGPSKDLRAEDVEWTLAQAGLLKSTLTQNPRAARREEAAAVSYNSSFIGGARVLLDDY